MRKQEGNYLVDSQYLMINCVYVLGLLHLSFDNEEQFKSDACYVNSMRQYAPEGKHEDANVHRELLFWSDGLV